MKVTIGKLTTEFDLAGKISTPFKIPFSIDGPDGSSASFFETVGVSRAAR